MRKFIREIAERYRLEDTSENRTKHFRGDNPDLILKRLLAVQLPPDGDISPQAGEQKKDAHEDRKALLFSAINAANSDNIRALYRTAFNRWSASLPTNAIQADLLTPEHDSRLIVGLGSENVLETGIRLHHTYGMPSIPGSALKGLAAHYCDQVWGARNNSTPSENALNFRGPRKDDWKPNRPADSQGKFHQLLFGSTDDGGCIVFHDAWLIPDSTMPLVLDVMTPHHPRWLDGSAPPTDFDSPTPVPFLSVSGTFRVAVSWHGPEDAQAKSWTERAKELLCEALWEWGVGGKTTSGYGRLGAPPTSEAGDLIARAAPTQKPSAPPAGAIVEAVLLSEKTKKGGWRAKHDPSGLAGPIQNSTEVPSDAQPGTRMQMIVASSNVREIAFRYPTASDKLRTQKADDKSKTAQDDRRGRRRR